MTNFLTPKNRTLESSSFQIAHHQLDLYSIRGNTLVTEEYQKREGLNPQWCQKNVPNRDTIINYIC